MRLIDADALKARIIMDLPSFESVAIQKAFILAMVSTRSVTPTIDAVPVVRCSDCKHWIGGWIDDKDDFIPPKCSKINSGWLGHQADDYCSAGERKVEDESEEKS